MFSGPGRAAQGRRPLVISPGEKAKVSLYGIEGEGYKIRLRLRSLREHGLSGPQRPAVGESGTDQGLQSIDAVHQFQIIYYNEQPKIFNPTGQAGRLVFGTEQNKALGSPISSTRWSPTEALHMKTP